MAKGSGYKFVNLVTALPYRQNNCYRIYMTPSDFMSWKVPSILIKRAKKSLIAQIQLNLKELRSKPYQVNETNPLLR